MTWKITWYKIKLPIGWAILERSNCTLNEVLLKQRRGKIRVPRDRLNNVLLTWIFQMLVKQERQLLEGIELFKKILLR